MQLPVKGVIYFYMFICVALLVFNLLYICRADHVKRRQQRKSQRWEAYLDGVKKGGKPAWSRRKLFRMLRNSQELMALYAAAEGRDQAEIEAVFRQNRSLFVELAQDYGKKAPMERAFFAYVIAAFYPAVGDKQDPLLEILLRYLDDSTVYCRENVLHALYTLGNMQAVEHAFVLMSQREWYHDPRLLADGLNRFQGEREKLAGRLWSRRRDLIECYQSGAIRFADALPGDDFVEDFLEALKTETLPTETQFALVRYFRRHADPRAKPELLRLLKEQVEGRRELAIAAAAALSSYPDGETRQALKEALRSRNWYVRQNAARSLKAMGATWEEIQAEIKGDRYATEMLEYVYGVQPAGAQGGKESEVHKAV